MFARSVSRLVVRRPRLSRSPFSGMCAPSAAATGGLLAVLLILMPPAVLAQGAEARMPQSSQDHVELAGLYQRLAAKQRAHAESLRISLSEQIKRLAVAPNKTGVELPWVTKVKREAQPEISRAETAAGQAERSAEYHLMRAQELAGLEFATLAADSSGVRR